MLTMMDAPRGAGNEGYLVVPEKSMLRGGNRELLALWRDWVGWGELAKPNRE